MKTKKIIVISFIFLHYFIFGQETISSGRLAISITQNSNGISISSIKDNGTELLNNSTNPALFNTIIHNSNSNTDETITALAGWTTVSINNNGDNAIINLSNPNNPNLPNTLTANITIATFGAKSSWDLSITGLGSNCSLIDTVFPHINIKADGDDTFLYPLYSGQLTENPGNSIDYFDDDDDDTDNTKGLYPRGWGTSMQFFAYYNANYGIYFGFHDTNASLKIFGIKNESGGIRIQCTNPAANKTINGNDWNMPGVFELDIFNGDWYDAALHYKEWVQNNATYWPSDNAERLTRQHNVGDIGVWLTSRFTDNNNPTTMQGYYETAIDYYDIPVGLHLYQWNSKLHDHYYPNYFPELTGFPDVVNNVQNNNDVAFMPYINGRLWDTGIGQGEDDEADDAAEETAAQNYFNNEGLASACKNSNGDIIINEFEDNEFAVMCPTQNPWQDILEDACTQITSDTHIGAKSIYIDMVCASSAIQCMDSTHGHTLGGGSFWRDGYKQMFENMHNNIPSGRFITAEGGCDFIADEVDAFMVQGWTTRNQVPAWQAIYTGKNQLFGTFAGISTYGDQRFYGRMSKAFVEGIQPGRYFISLGINPNESPEKAMASAYTLATSHLRYKLRNFMSYGSMKRPLTIDYLGATAPEISYTVYDWGGNKDFITVTNKAIRTSTWQNNNEVVVVFANGRVQSPIGTTGGNINFDFNFNPSDYGLEGALTIQEITPENNGTIETVTASTFPKNVSLENLDLIAYKITAENVANINSPTSNEVMIYPNPSSETIRISSKKTIKKVLIYNNLGQLIQTTIPQNNSIDISRLNTGIYILKLLSEFSESTTKLIKK